MADQRWSCEASKLVVTKGLHPPVMSIGSGNIPRNISRPSRHQVIKQARSACSNEERDGMRMNWMLSAAVVAMSVTAAAGAQSTKAMGKPSKGDTMSMTYTGCVQSVNHGGVFLLTQVDGAGSVHSDMSVKHQVEMAMKHDDM